MDTVWDTVVATSDTARGPLMPSPRLRLRLIPTTDTVWDMPATDTDTVWATPHTDTVLDTDTDTVSTVATSDTARGPLRPSPRLRLRPIPTTDTAMDTAVDTMVDTAMDTVVASMDIMDKSTTSRSFSESPAAMSASNGLFQFEFRPPPVLPVSVLPG